MLLRSSSTPIPPTFFSSDSPTRDATATANHHKHIHDNPTTKLSIHLPKLRSFSCNSSPISNSSSGYSAFSPKSIQRAQSDSNLQGLSSISFNRDEFFTSKTPTRLNRQRRKMLRTEPSFSIYNDDGVGGNEGDDLAMEVEKSRMGSGSFSFGNKSMDLIEEVDDEEGKDESLVSGIKIRGIGSSGSASGGGADMKKITTFDDNGDVEDYYKRMLAQDPSNALFLRNYAQFLQSKDDLYGAEEYYFRATLADPKDGEIMLQYAKLVWELHRDQDRALSYFETAARAAPEDSHVLAAYAGFLWEIDDNEDDDEDHVDDDHIEKSAVELEGRPVTPQLHPAAEVGVNASATVSNIIGTAECPNFGGKVEDYYKKKLKEDPSNPLFLRNYAQFLYQSKGDLQGAELYYSRAMLAAPRDGEVISQYAKLVWELHQDQRKASYYFEQAVQAAPEDSHVLAARARFLWEADDEEDGGKLDDYKLPVFQGMTSASA